MQMYNDRRHLVNVPKGTRCLVKVSEQYATTGLAVLTWNGRKLIDESFPELDADKQAKAFIVLNERGEPIRISKQNIYNSK